MTEELISPSSYRPLIFAACCSLGAIFYLLWQILLSVLGLMSPAVLYVVIVPPIFLVLGSIAGEIIYLIFKNKKMKLSVDKIVFIGAIIGFAFDFVIQTVVGWQLGNAFADIHRSSYLEALDDIYTAGLSAWATFLITILGGAITGAIIGYSFARIFSSEETKDSSMQVV